MKESHKARTQVFKITDEEDEIHRDVTQTEVVERDSLIKQDLNDLF